jgi:hypothetical protein
MHGPINVKFPNNTSKWQMGMNSAFKGLNEQVFRYQTPFHYAGLLAKFGLQWANINSIHRMNNG